MEDMKDKNDVFESIGPSVDEEMENVQETSEEEFSLSDDRRVKVLSPGQLVLKRFFRKLVF